MEKYLNICLKVLKDFGDFKGRTNREYFWVFSIACVIIGALLGIISDKVSWIFDLVIMIPSLAVGVRRMHDVGKSGLNLLWSLTIIGIVYVFYLALQPSQIGPNKWGVPQTEETEI